MSSIGMEKMKKEIQESLKKEFGGEFIFDEFPITVFRNVFTDSDASFKSKKLDGGGRIRLVGIPGGVDSRIYIINFVKKGSKFILEVIWEVRIEGTHGISCYKH